MLDLVPLTGSRREMADRNDKSRLLGQLLQFPLPESETRTVAPPTIGGDEERAGARVMLAPKFTPPSPDRGHGEGGGVVVHTHADPAQVAAEVVDAVGDHLPLLRFQEIVNLHFLRVPLRPPRSAGILEPAHQFLLLGVDRDRWLAALQLGLDR